MGSRWSRACREQLAGTAPSRAGKGSGGNSGCSSSSDEDGKAFEGWQQLLVVGSQLVHRALWQPGNPPRSLWMSKVGAWRCEDLPKVLARALPRVGKPWLRISRLHKLGGPRGVDQCLRPPPVPPPCAVSRRVRSMRPGQCQGTDKMRGQCIHRGPPHTIAPTWSYHFKAPRLSKPLIKINLPERPHALVKSVHTPHRAGVPSSQGASALGC